MLDSASALFCYDFRTPFHPHLSIPLPLHDLLLHSQWSFAIFLLIHFLYNGDRYARLNVFHTTSICYL